MQEQMIGRHGLMRDLNYRAVVERLASDGPLSRADLARELSLSPASVSRLVEALLAAELLCEGEPVASRAGRPQIPLRINAAAALVAGISIRSRSMRLRLADLDGRPLGQERLPRHTESPERLCAQLRDMLLGAREAHAPGRPIAAVAVGVSGAWDERGRRVHAAPNLAVLEGVDALELLQRQLQGLVVGDNITLDNDINFAALGEHAHGAARGAADFFYLSLGSGVGGAAVVDGRLHRGVRGFAGELGYLPVWGEDGVRPLESRVGRTALERYAEEAGLESDERDVFERLADHRPEAARVADRVSGFLATALASIVTTLDPGLVVLGGGVGRHSDTWTERIRRRLAELVPVVPEVLATELGRDASLLGAVAYGRGTARDALIRALLPP